MSKTPPPPPYEHTTPLDWRIEQMNRADIQPAVSQLLALTNSDLHKIVDAKQAGATDEQLLSIFGSDSLPPRTTKHAAPPLELSDPARANTNPFKSDDAVSGGSIEELDPNV